MVTVKFIIDTKIKSCNYLNHILMRIEANEAGADDAIELDMEGYVCEAPGYNVFMVKKGVLYTPKDNILVGVVAAPHPEYDANRWWTSSSGVRSAIGEAIAFLYARFVFNPQERAPAKPG